MFVTDVMFTRKHVNRYIRIQNIKVGRNEVKHLASSQRLTYLIHNKIYYIKLLMYLGPLARRRFGGIYRKCSGGTNLSHRPGDTYSSSSRSEDKFQY